MDTYEAARSLGITPSTIRNQAEKQVLDGQKVNGKWSFTPEAVERYRQERLGHHPAPNWTEEQKARRIAAIRSPETRAKMRAAKLSRPQTAEHRANIAAGHRDIVPTAEHRRKISAAQKGKTLDPKHLDALRAYHRTRRGKPLPATTRAKVAESLARAHREGRRPYSPLENRAAEVLVPPGWERSVLLDGHAFDFGSADGQFLVEVNGCAWHDHRAVKPECPTRVRRTTNARDEERRSIARANGRILVELWECEEAAWPLAIALIG